MFRRAGTLQAVDLGHRSASGLVFAYFGGESELMSGSPLLTKTTSTGRAYLVPSPNFPGERAFSTNTTSAFTAGGFNPNVAGIGGTGRTLKSLLQTITTQHTIMWIGYHRSKTNNANLFGIPYADVSGGTTTTGAPTYAGYALALGMGASATWRQTMGYRTVGNAAASNYSNPPYDPWNARRAIAWVRNAAVGWITSNGRTEYSASLWQSPAIDWNSGNFGWPTLHGIDYNSTSYGNIDAVTDALLIWNRPLSMAELADLQAYPHQLLQQVRTIIGVASSVTNESVSPSTVSATASVPAPSVAVQGSQSVSPSTVSATASVPAPSVAVSGSQSVSPATVTATASIPTPGVNTSAAVSPLIVQASASIPSFTVAQSLTATTADVTATASVPAPSVSVSGSQVVSPATVSATASVIAPTVSASQGVAPSTVTATASVPSPTTAATARVSPGTVSATATVPSPGVAVSGSQVVSPATVTATASVITPTVVAAGPSAGPYATITGRRPDSGITGRRPASG